jgi:hypothetical protein
MYNDLLNAEQAADYLSVSVRTLANWRCRNFPQIGYLKIGRCIRYRRSSLDQFLDMNSHANGDM